MANPVVHFEIRSKDPDASRAFYGNLFGWSFPEGDRRHQGSHGTGSDRSRWVRRHRAGA